MNRRRKKEKLGARGDHRRNVAIANANECNNNGCAYEKNIEQQEAGKCRDYSAIHRPGHQQPHDSQNNEIMEKNEKVSLQHAHDMKADGDARALDEAARGNQSRRCLVEHRRDEGPHDQAGGEVRQILRDVHAEKLPVDQSHGHRRDRRAHHDPAGAEHGEAIPGADVVEGQRPPNVVAAGDVGQFVQGARARSSIHHDHRAVSADAGRMSLKEHADRL